MTVVSSGAWCHAFSIRFVMTSPIAIASRRTGGRSAGASTNQQRTVGVQRARMLGRVGHHGARVVPLGHEAHTARLDARGVEEVMHHPVESAALLRDRLDELPPLATSAELAEAAERERWLTVALTRGDRRRIDQDGASISISVGVPGP